MIILPLNIISFTVVRPTNNDRYRNIKVQVSILNNEGKSVIDGMVPFETLDLIHMCLSELYDNKLSMKVDLPMTSAMCKYSIYGGLVNSEMYHIFIIRDDFNGNEETILDLRLDGFDLIYAIYEFGTDLFNITEGNIEII